MISSDRSSTSPPPRSLLVVDDDRVFRQRLSRAFSERGFDVAEAASVDEALLAARTEAPELAVVDLRMPGRSGLEAVRELLAIESATRVVVLTGYGSIATAVDAIRLGAVHYLTKPVDVDQILCALQGELPVQFERGAVPSLANVEWEHLQRVLDSCGGNISEAARLLGMHRRSLQRKLAKEPPVR